MCVYHVRFSTNRSRTYCFFSSFLPSFFSPFSTDSIQHFFPTALSAMSASDKEAIDETALPVAELRVHVGRCDRLLQHPALLQRLQDRGDSIRERHARFSKELARREASRQERADGQRDTEDAKQRNEQEQLREAAPLSQAEDQRQLVEKYKDRRVPVEDTVRRAYGGSLSEREIQRILADVPTNYFLTYTETVEMQKTAAKEARKEELRRLRMQTE
ncbi:hypothetical protein STCU_01608 [Strigomonas culicis]|uniref:Uncharacterized protein n=1 Tax=Strigomonas culicis TaxID=28005 RepID=S9UIM4_9TRYP|nr:hypothetical protein STCU_04868 [Strigomonas culicis]EPY34391.1 hypothetical protein STCU_01608 [Strigomonas culicis]|eukprot:EPY28813.1 hypothetical protein STCU_04868 [Strigomonas culicis]